MLLDRGVINTGPLVALSLAGRLDLLPALFAEFWIPEQVFHEVVLACVGRPGASALADARWAAHVCPAPTPDPLLIAELDLGEAAVIALARSLAPWRKIAHQIYGLPVKGTAGLLVEAHRRGLLGDVRATC